MNVLAAIVLTFIVGFCESWAWAKLVRAVNDRQAIAGAAWNFIVVTSSTVVTLTVWSASTNSPLVLVTWAISTSLGTGIVIYKTRNVG